MFGIFGQFLQHEQSNRQAVFRYTGEVMERRLQEYAGATSVHHKDGVFTVTCKTRIPKVKT